MSKLSELVYFLKNTDITSLEPNEVLVQLDNIFSNIYMHNYHLHEGFLS